MQFAVITRMARHSILDEGDRCAIQDITSRGTVYQPRHEIVHQGSMIDTVTFVLDGIACRSHFNRNGQRQILNWLLPGEAFGIGMADGERTTHSMTALTTCTVAHVPRAQLRDLVRNRPGVGDAIQNVIHAETNSAQDWLINVGRRQAHERLAHLLCDYVQRMRVLGQATANEVSMPFTQETLSDAMALTPVHTNRTVRRLREAGLIQTDRGHVVIRDLCALELYAHGCARPKPPAT